MKKIKTGMLLPERESESLGIYLDEIGKENLLTAEQERELSAQIKQGDDSALSRLTTANLRFVVSVAKWYQGRGVAITDLISEGNLGLMKAARNFDATRGVRFVKYAEVYVRRQMEQAIGEQTGGQAFSVDAPLMPGKPVNLLSVLKDEGVPDADGHALTESLRAALLEAMEVLDARERTVVAACYGIQGTHLTMAEIGTYMGLKRERVRQIRNTAIRKMLRAADNAQLKSFLR